MRDYYRQYSGCTVTWSKPKWARSCDADLGGRSMQSNTTLKALNVFSLQTHTRWYLPVIKQFCYQHSIRDIFSLIITQRPLYRPTNHSSWNHPRYHVWAPGIAAPRISQSGAFLHTPSLGGTVTTMDVFETGSWRYVGYFWICDCQEITASTWLDVNSQVYSHELCQ